jgi:diguanylate cyclase (GGDEF)-like protein
MLGVEMRIPSSQKLVSGGMLFWAAVLTLAANYSVTRERRFSFLLQLHGGVQRGQLADANAELLALSSTDRLTGLPNRHSYETRLLELWQMTRENLQPLSAVMIDVDHFKRVNDTYGHPYGDRVLQRIANLLQQALRGENDFVARFGGEEFVVLLPSSDETVARLVADRILTLIRVAGSPALAKDSPLPPPEGLSTVSCGLATAWPNGTSDPNLLISAADQAMYRAKREGRNRVCCAPSGLLGLPRKVSVMPASANRG